MPLRNATTTRSDRRAGRFSTAIEALPDHRLGIAQLSNRLLIPPDGLPFQGNPNGEFLGYTWMALPFTDATTVDPPTGDQSWTCFLSTANFKGPIAYYIPETWSKIGKLFNYPFIYGRGLDARPGVMGGGAMEINTVPRFDGRGRRGARSTRISPSCNSRLTSREDLPGAGRDLLLQGGPYDEFKAWRKRRPALHPVDSTQKGAWKSTADDADHAARPGRQTNSAASRRSSTPRSLKATSGDCNGPRATSVPGDGSRSTTNRSAKERVAVPAADVPAETQLQGQEFPLAKLGAAYTSPTTGAWSQPGPKQRPVQGHARRRFRGDLFVVSLRRPALVPAVSLGRWKKAALQAFVEKIHANWPIDRDYMAPPSRGTS